jgi:hypothetical protein
MKIEINISDKLVDSVRRVFTTRNAVFAVSSILFGICVFLFGAQLPDRIAFSSGQIISSSQVNTNFKNLWDKVNEHDAASASTAWTAVTFGTGWSNYNNGYQAVQYKKFGNLVFLRGLATSSTWSSTSPICILPAGYRPTGGRLIFAQEGNNNAIVRVDILNTGEVIWISGGAGTSWISLEGIIFSVD